MFDFLKPYALIIWLVIAGLVIGGAMIAFERNNASHERIGYERSNSEWLAKEAIAKQAALTKERELIRQKEEAQNAASKREIKLEKSIVDLRHQLDGMRFAASEQRKRIATLSVDAARRVADAGIAVFRECSTEYSTVAVIADKCLSERQTLIDAWPK